MRKVLFVVLAAIVAIIISACGGKKAQQAGSAPSEPEAQISISPPDLESLTKDIETSAEGRWEGWTMDFDESANLIVFEIQVSAITSNVWLQSYCNMVKTSISRFAPTQKYKVDIIAGEKVVRQCGSK